MRAIHQIHVGADTFDLETGDVSGQTGRARLRRKALDDLRVLAATPGAVVTKETLFSTVWSETHVTEDSLVQCITEIRKALGADRALLETIPRQRYRLVGKSTVGATTKNVARSGSIRLMIGEFEPVNLVPEILSIAPIWNLLRDRRSAGARTVFGGAPAGRIAVLINRAQ